MPVSPFASTLLAWFSENRRDLPWRQTTDPYAIWLSEIILQQTRIQQGMAYWQRFMRRWPDVGLLAQASEDEVLREWQGLGYYSRARNLHHAARQIVGSGHFPDTYEAIRRLKGVGDYTAAAIASIAFGLPHAVVDGNVFRVLSRHFAISTPINTTTGKREFTALANELMPPQEPSAFNQAMMDFGALQCVPLSPRCPACPLAETCAALRQGRVGELPVKLKARPQQHRHLIYIYARCEGHIALRRRPAGDIWQGLWEPVSHELPPHSADVLRLPFTLPPAASLRLLSKGVRHVLTHRVLLADFYLLETATRPELPAGYVWIAEQERQLHAVSRLVSLLYEAVDKL